MRQHNRAHERREGDSGGLLLDESARKGHTGWVLISVVEYDGVEQMLEGQRAEETADEGEIGEGGPASDSRLGRRLVLNRIADRGYIFKYFLVVVGGTRRVPPGHSGAA